MANSTTFVFKTIQILHFLIRPILYLLFVIAFARGLTAQTNEISWEFNSKHFGIENGLPSSETYQVHQDRSGLLWILTDRGVVRYDGFETHKYTTQNGLCDNVNFRIYEDPEGGVWFVGFNGMLSVFKNGKMQPYKYNRTLKKAIPNGRIAYVALCVEKDQLVTYSAYSLGMIVQIDKDGKMERLSKPYSDRSNFYETGDELVCSKLCHSPSPIYLVKKNKERVFLGKMMVNDITRTKKHKGFYFLLTMSKLYMLYDQHFQLLINNQPEIISLDADKDFLYIGFYKGGMKKYRFNPKTRKLHLVKHYLPDYSVSSAFVDLNRTLWVTTLERGLFAIPDESFSQLAIKKNVLQEEVRFINGNKDKIIMTKHVGNWQQLYPPYLYKDAGKVKRRYNLVPFNNGFAFERGVFDWSDWRDVDATYSFNPMYATDSFAVGLNYYATDIYEAGKNITYITSLMPAKKLPLSRAYNWFYIFEHKKAFIVYDTGLKVFDIQNSSVAGKYRSILNKPIRKMCHNRFWGLVVASASSGLFEIDMKKETGKQLAPTISLGKQILDIFFDEQDRLWVATEKGLFLLVKRDNQVVCVKFVNRKLLSSAEVLSMYSFNNVVYLATKFGVQKIDFFKVKKQTEDCPVELFSVRAFAQNKESANKHLFPSKTDLIKISLSNKSLSGNLEYRYRFGADQTWVRSDKGEIILNNPSAGEYHLEVSSLDMFNNWTSPRQIGSFTVEKIIFLRWYFIVCYIGLIILVFFGVLKYSVRVSNRKNELLNRMMELERMALSAQMNPHFIFNSLNSIHSFLLYEENENAEKYLIRFAKLIRQTLSNSRANYITISEEYETLKNYILLENMRFRDAFTFQIACNFNELPLEPCIPPMLIQPYVENAIIHGLPKRKEGAELLIRFYQEDEHVKVMIRDNGIGYSESKRTKRDTGHKSYGTQITEERLKSLQENSNEGFGVSIKDTDPSNTEFPGTTVILTIPIPTN